MKRFFIWDNKNVLYLYFLLAPNYWESWKQACLKPFSLCCFVNKRAWLFLATKWPLNYKEKSPRALPHGQIWYKMKRFQQKGKTHKTKWQWITPNNKHIFVSVSVTKWLHVTSSHKRQRSEAFRSVRPCVYFNAISLLPIFKISLKTQKSWWSNNLIVIMYFSETTTIWLATIIIFLETGLESWWWWEYLENIEICRWTPYICF